MGGSLNDEVLRLGKQLADGLEAGHEQEIVHCDLKPGNLRLTAKDNYLERDFANLARAARVVYSQRKERHRK
jgi:serine/threonine protein kinase